jgi:spermidine synthase
VPKSEHQKQVALLFSTFVIAICGLIYELLAGTLSSYLLGDSIYQFSLVIGLFMSSMGLGAWLSRFFEKKLPDTFVKLQLLIGLLGGFTAPVLFFSFAVIDNYTPLLFLTTMLLGAMLGIEIPLIIRILKDEFTLKLNVSNVFTADYIGALIAALLFPLILVPQLGILKTGFLFGLFNVGVGLLGWLVFKHELENKKLLIVKIIIAFMLLIAGFIYSDKFTSRMENRLYQDEIIYAETTPYQRIVLTRRDTRLRFYINGALQFDTIDEYRYHESLVHPAMLLTRHHENILILGGGDGLAIREILKYPDVKHIDLVDLDPAVTRLFGSNKTLAALNENSLEDKRVNIINQDAWKFLENNQALYDVIIIDLPDPNNLSLSRLYTREFYTLIQQHLAATGTMVTQATSPMYSRKAFWSIATTLESLQDKHLIEENHWYTLPYHSYIPSFGEWGFVLASRIKPDWHRIRPDANMRYLTVDILHSMAIFPPDMMKLPVEVNQISSHPLLKYYEDGWSKWYE